MDIFARLEKASVLRGPTVLTINEICFFRGIHPPNFSDSIRRASMTPTRSYDPQSDKECVFDKHRQVCKSQQNIMQKDNYKSTKFKTTKNPNFFKCIFT